MRTPPQDSPGPPPDAKARDGRTFVILVGVFLVLLAGFLLIVSPRLQDQLGLGEPLPFRTPPTPTEVALDAPEGLGATAIWDSGGVCAEVVDSTGTTFRTCAVPDPLRPIWAIDAPDDAAEPFLLVATPPDVANLEGTTTDGEVVAGLTQARELPAAWAVIPLPDGAALRDLQAFGVASGELGGAQCGVEAAPTDGPERLSGGCVVPRED